MRSSSVAPSRGTTTTTTHKSSSPPSPHTAVGLDILAELRHLRDSIQTTTSSSSTSSENAATGHHVATKQQLKSTSRGRSGSATVSSRRLNGIAEGGIGSKGSMSGSGSGGYAQQVLPNQHQQQHHNRTAFGSHQTQSNDPFNHNRIKSKSSSSITSMDASGSGDIRSGGGHPPLAPSETAVAAGDGLLSANVGVQPDVAAVKRELHRVTESYGALVREYRSAKIIWEAEDSKKSDEISRLSAGLSGADRSRRDVYEALKTAKESRLEAQREREACALYKEKAESEKKLRDSAERRATDSAEQLKTLHSRVKELSSLNEELEISRARESAAIKRVRDSDERIRAMLKDREEMAAELSTLKNLHKEGAENFAKAKTFASMRESLEYEAKDAQDRLASMAIRLAEVEENAAKVVPLTEERDDARRHVDHLESVQSELLTAVQLQAADLSKMKEEVESHSGDAKRIGRLEKALEAYRNVEKLFTQKTGQGFFGPAGLAAAAAAATSPIEGDGDHGATTAFAGGALASELVGEYIDRLRSSISAEVKSELSASISSERQKAAGSVLEAEMRMLEHQKAADAACSAREVLEAWKRRALAVEETVSSIISAPKLARSSSSSATSGLESSCDANDTNTYTGQDPLDPDIASDPLYTSEWDKLPSFVAVLPRLASAVGRLRSDIGAAIRRRRLAEIEAQDLREELACIRGDDVAAVAMHRVASNDVRNALKRASDERSNLRAEISSLTAQLSAANIRISDLESKLVQAGSKLTSARQQRDEKEKDCISIRESLEIEKAACANAKAALATAEQRLHDAKETNERALKMLAARDAEITRMKVYGENHHGVAAHQGDTIEGGSNNSRQAIKPPPAPSLYGSVSVPNYNPSSVFAAGAAAKASANEAAAQQLEKEKEKEREEQAKIDRREKERKSLAKAARAKAEAAAVAAAAQASAAEAEERRRYAEAEAAAAAAVTAAEEARAVEAKRAAKEARRRMREAEAAAAEADALRRRELEAVTEQIRVMEARRNEEKKDTERRAAAIARQATEAAERLAAMQQHQQQQHQQQQQSTNNQTTSAMLLMQQAAINSALLRRGSRDSALLELSLRRRDSESSSTRGDIRKPSSSSSSRHDDAGRNRTSRSHRHHRDREEDAPLSSPGDGGDSIRQQEHGHDHDRDYDLKKKKHLSLSSREKTETKLEDAISSSSAAADAERSTRGGGGGGAGTKRPTSSTLSSLPERSVEPSSLGKHPQAQESSHSSRSNTTTAATFSLSSSSGGAAAGAASSTLKTVKSLAPPPHSKSLSMNNPKGAVETRPTATADTSFSISTPSGGEEEEEDRDDTDHYYTQHPTHLESVPEWRSAVSPTPREKPPANRTSTQTRMTGKAVIVTRPSVVTAIVDNDATVESEASSADTTSIFAGITGVYSSSSDTVSAAVASKGNGDREGEGRGEGRGRQVRRESISGLLSAQELADSHFKTTLRSREGSVVSSQASSRASSRSRSGSVGDFSRSYYHKRR